MFLLSPDNRNDLLEGIDFFCRCFLGPDPGFCETLLSEPGKEMFDRLGRLLGEGARPVTRLLLSDLCRFSNAEDLHGTLEAAYVRLFVNARGGIAAPLYQSCYEPGSGALMGESARLMQERLAACGLSISGRFSEPPDHLSVELEYLFYLLDTGWREENAQRLDDAVSFAMESLLPWVRRLLARIENENSAPFYPPAAALLAELLAKIAPAGEVLSEAAAG